MKKKLKKKLPYRRCAGAMLVNDEGLVFVAQRSDTPGEAWQMPQGGVDKGESPKKAVLRELKEETGTDKAKIIAKSKRWHKYDLPDEFIGTFWKGRYRGQKQKWFVLRFLGDDGDIDLNAHGKPEFSAWKWVALDEIVDLIVPFKRTLYEKLVAEFRPVIEDVQGREKQAP